MTTHTGQWLLSLSHQFIINLQSFVWSSWGCLLPVSIMYEQTGFIMNCLIMESITSLIIILMNNQLTVIFPEDYLNNSILSNLCWFGGSDMGRLLTLFKARFHLLTNPPPTYYPPSTPHPTTTSLYPSWFSLQSAIPISCMHRISIRNSHQDYFEYSL